MSTSRETAAAICRGTGIPFVYHHWPVGSDRSFPCLAYRTEGRRPIPGDDGEIGGITEWCIDLYSECYDEALAETVQASLSAAGVSASRTDTYIPEERLFMTSWAFETFD